MLGRFISALARILATTAALLFSGWNLGGAGLPGWSRALLPEVCMSAHTTWLLPTRTAGAVLPDESQPTDYSAMRKSSHYASYCSPERHW